MQRAILGILISLGLAFYITSSAFAGLTNPLTLQLRIWPDECTAISEDPDYIAGIPAYCFEPDEEPVAQPEKVIETITYDGERILWQYQQDGSLDESTETYIEPPATLYTAFNARDVREVLAVDASLFNDIVAYTVVVGAAAFSVSLMALIVFLIRL